jgi:hypothetical protein
MGQHTLRPWRAAAAGVVAADVVAAGVVAAGRPTTGVAVVVGEDTSEERDRVARVWRNQQRAVGGRGVPGAGLGRRRRR